MFSQGDIGLNAAKMVMQLVKDNRKIVDRITHKHIDDFVDLLRQNKVIQAVVLTAAQWLNGQNIGLSTKRTFCVEYWASSCTLPYSRSPSFINEYLVIDSGGYLGLDSFRTLIAAWLDDSQRSRDGFD